MKHTLLLINLIILLSSCGRTTGSTNEKDTIDMRPCPTFMAGNALEHIKKQCAMGPRVPGTAAWQACGDSIVAWFSTLGLTVEEQNTTVVRYDGTRIPCRNITARLNPENNDRILLSKLEP